jgi:hypothetical protein
MANPAYPPRPARTSAKGRNGVAEGGDPTVQPGQTPADIFGFAQSYSTGAPGSAGGHAPADVTVQQGQLEEGISGLKGTPITDTGVPGGTGISNSAGGDTVTYTDPFALQGYGNDAARVTVQGHVSGHGDWTQANTEGYDSGPTLPGLENARPTSTGAGQGHARVERP